VRAAAAKRGRGRAGQPVQAVVRHRLAAGAVQGVGDAGNVAIAVIRELLAQRAARVGARSRQLAGVLHHRVDDAVAISELLERAVREILRPGGIGARLRGLAQGVGAKPTTSPVGSLCDAKCATKTTLHTAG